MSHIEVLREELYQVIASGDRDSIIKVSQMLDKLILNYTKQQIQTNKKIS